MKARLWRLLGILIIILPVLWLVQQSPHDDPGSPPSRPDPQIPDFFVDQGRITKLNSDGQPQYQLTAELAQHFPVSEYTRLSQVTLVYYRSPQAPWRATAREATVPDRDNEPLRLRGDVHLRIRDPEQPLPLDLHTDRLLVWVQDERAETDQAVRIVRGEAVVNASGLEADLKRARLRLGPNVKGVYAD